MIKHIFIFFFASVTGVGMGYFAGFNKSENGGNSPELERTEPRHSPFINHSSNKDHNSNSKENEKTNLYARVKLMSFDQAKEAMDELLRKPDGTLIARFHANDLHKIYVLANRMGTLAPQLAMKHLKNIHGFHAKNFAFKGIIYGWANQDIESAVQYYRNNSESLKNSGTASLLASQWLKKSPDKAWQFVSSLPFEEQRSAAKNFMTSIAQENPAQISKYIMLPETPKDVADAFIYRSDLLKKWQEADSAGFEEWKNTLSEKMRGKFLPSLDQEPEWQSLDIADNPDEAAETLKKKTTKELQGYLSQQFYKIEREMGPVLGLDWLTKNFQKEDVMHILDNRMMKAQPRDFAALEQWIQQSSDDRIRALALRELCRSKPLPGHDMTNALDMASKTDWDDKHVLMKNMLNTWVQTDEAAALNWLNSPACPEQKRAEWKKEMDKKRAPLIK